MLTAHLQNGVLLKGNRKQKKAVRGFCFSATLRTGCTPNQCVFGHLMEILAVATCISSLFQSVTTTGNWNRKQNYTLKYRMIVFDGKIDSKTAEMYWNSFAAIRN